MASSSAYSSGHCCSAVLPQQLVFMEEDRAVPVYTWLDPRGRAVATAPFGPWPESSLRLAGVIPIIVLSLVAGSALGQHRDRYYHLQP